MPSIQERVDQAHAGHHPTLIARMPSGWAMLGDEQFFEGYTLLIADPVVEHLTDLDDEARRQFLADMALLGEALLAVTDATRINYEILGNTDHALHAHIFPRYSSEPDYQLHRTVWHYDDETRGSVPLDPERHGALQRRLADYLASCT